MSDVRHWVPTGLDALELLALLPITYISLVGGLHSIGNTPWQMSLLSQYLRIPLAIQASLL